MSKRTNAFFNVATLSLTFRRFRKSQQFGKSTSLFPNPVDPPFLMLIPVVENKTPPVDRTNEHFLQGIESCPADAFNVHLHFLPLNLYVKYTVACRAVRLCEFRWWTAKLYFQSNILDEVTRKLWVFQTDYAICKPSFPRNFSVGFPTGAK